MSAKQVIGDDHPEHGVAEELQALVGFKATVLIGVGAVGKRKSQPLGVDLDAERAKQRSQIRSMAPRGPSPHGDVVSSGSGRPDDLAAVVLAAMWTGQVRRLRLPARPVRTRRESRRGGL